MGVHDPTDFRGRVVAVTGGTRGIGLVIAQAFLTAGAQVVVCGRREPDDLPGTEDRSASFVAADVRDPDQAGRVVDEAVRRHDRLDVLVNNAGGSSNGEAATLAPRTVEKIVALNMLAPFYVAQQANAVMQRQDSGGAIVNIGSVAAYRPAPLTSAYAAAKAGLLQFTRALALEWAPRVRVNHISSGMILTEQSARHYGTDGGASVARTIPMQRMAAGSDVAAACLYLASPLASYVTGADLAVHGGGEIPAWFVAAAQAQQP
ncbi:MAG TPA: SDR family oxidoreductase [Mycobacteriales bacterium]|nr:SDR family oxidoreductase [Mycobacteriales bacterium]